MVMKQTGFAKLFIILSSVVLVTFLVGCLPTSQSGIAKKAKTGDKIVVSLKCFSKIKDQGVLEDIVLTGKPWGRRRAALDFVTDEKVLTNIAEKTKEFDIKYYANQRLDALKAGRSLDTVPKIHFNTVKDAASMDSKYLDPSSKWSGSGNCFCNIY